MKISRELYKTIWQVRNILIKINEPITKANPCKGEYYIYGFYNCDWKDWFYVGKGYKTRYADIHDRNAHIKSIIRAHNCITCILFDGLDEKSALYAEKVFKAFFANSGSPVIDYEISNLNQRIGIERAKREGKYTGGQRKKISNFGEHYARYMAREVTKSALARELGVSRPTLYRLIKEYNDSPIEQREHLTEREKDLIGRTCINCGSDENIEYHHVIPLSIGGRNVLSNIQPLCYECHSKLHFGESKHFNHSALTKAGLARARANGKQIGGKTGVKLTTKKSVSAKEIIRTHSKDFGGTLSDAECIKLAGISRNSFYKYKREIKEQFDLYETAMSNYDELADFSLEDLE